MILKNRNSNTNMEDFYMQHKVTMKHEPKNDPIKMKSVWDEKQKKFVEIEDVKEN